MLDLTPWPGKVKVHSVWGAMQGDAFLLAHPQRALAALQFTQLDDRRLSFVVQTNSTVKFFKGVFQDPNTYVQLPLQSAVERAFARIATNGTAAFPQALKWLFNI